MYNYSKNDNVFTKDNIKLDFTSQQVKNIIKAGNILKQATFLPLERKIILHHEVKKVIGGGDYLACAKTYAKDLK
jgi:hypothetical protein